MVKKKIDYKNDMIKNMNKTVTELSKENKQLKECMKDKDKRITKMENRWECITGILGLLGILGLAFLVLGGGILLWHNDETLFYNVMISIGCVTTVYITVATAFFLFFYFLENEDADDALFGAIFFGALATVAILIVYEVLIHGNWDGDIITNATELPVTGLIK